LFDEKIEAVFVHGGLTGFHDALASPFCYLPHDVVIPGVLTAGDLCDLVAAIAPRPLRLDGLVDGANRRSSVENSRKQYAIAITAYRHAHAEKRFVITNGDLRILQWLLRTDAAAR
jgi:hypothetical protein